MLQNESLIWCPVYKAASTSWIKNLYSLIGLGPENETALDKKFPGFVIVENSIISDCFVQAAGQTIEISGPGRVIERNWENELWQQ